jgi:hypothetical protein
VAMALLGHRRIGGLGSAFSGDVHRARPLAAREAARNRLVHRLILGL